MFWFGPQWSKGGVTVTEGAGSFSLCSQNVSDFMLKKKLLPLKIELLVILNRFGLVLLWRPQQMWITYPFHLQNWTIGLSFKNKKICEHVKNFKTPLPPPSISTSWMYGSLQVYEIWIFFCFTKNYFSVLWTKGANRQNVAKRHF